MQWLAPASSSDQFSSVECFGAPINKTHSDLKVQFAMKYFLCAFDTKPRVDLTSYDSHCLSSIVLAHKIYSLSLLAVHLSLFLSPIVISYTDFELSQLLNLNVFFILLLKLLLSLFFTSCKMEFYSCLNFPYQCFSVS